MAGLVFALCVGLAGAQGPGDGSSAASAKQAWTRAATSGGLHNAGQTRTVTYAPTLQWVPDGSRITRVYANRHYAGNASVQTSLCWDASTRCVDIVGGHLNTDAFNGLDASRPMTLVHRMIAPHGGPIPLYIKGNVTVWFTPPEARSEP